MSFIKAALVTKKRKLQSLSINEKVSIVNEAKNGINIPLVAMKYSVPVPTLKGWMQLDKKGQLKEIPNGNNIKRLKISKYAAVERKLIAYINLRNQYYAKDGCGLTQQILKEKALMYADSDLNPEDRVQFKAPI